MATTGQGVSALIDAASGVMTDLAMHPLALEIDSDGTRMLAVMNERALLTRSRGPYSQDNLPPEALEMIEWAALRWSTKPEQPEFTIEGGGPWPALVMVLPVSRVMVRYVVPEDAPPVYQPDPGNVTLSGDIKLTLRFLVDSLRAASRMLGDEPPVALTLSFPDDPDYETHVAGIPDEFRHVIPPVVATIELDRSRCSQEQRAAHDEALRSVAYNDQPVEPLGLEGFTTRIGSARLQDSSG
jgi:hypothetical protein